MRSAGRRKSRRVAAQTHDLKVAEFVAEQTGVEDGGMFYKIQVRLACAPSSPGMLTRAPRPARRGWCTSSKATGSGRSSSWHPSQTQPSTCAACAAAPSRWPSPPSWAASWRARAWSSRCGSARCSPSSSTSRRGRSLPTRWAASCSWCSPRRRRRSAACTTPWRRCPHQAEGCVSTHARCAHPHS